MKKWNRILAAVLTLSLTAGLTACGGSTSDATANNASMSCLVCAMKRRLNHGNDKETVLRFG